MEQTLDEEQLRALRDRYLAAQLRGDRRQAVAVITEANAAGGVNAAALARVIADAQREIGRLWQEDEISVAEEHVATAISQMALSFVYQIARPAHSNGKRVLVGCVDGELHDFPARFAADALDLAGFEVRFLGASVPLESLLAAIDKDRPDLVALSVTMPFNAPAAREVVLRIRQRTGSSIPIAIGGGECEWTKALAKELSAEITGCSAADFVAAASRFLGVARR